MNCSLMRWTGVLLICGAVLFAQEAPHATDKQAQVFGPMQVLTDTMGVDFGPYVQDVIKVVKKNWYSLIPESAMPPKLKRGKLAIEFFIRKDGKVSGMQLDVSSGDVSLDRAAWGAITSSNPFHPLPDEFKGQNLGLRMYFYYNPTPEDLPQPLKLVAGSSHQFPNGPYGATWTVTGPGCTGLACGSISSDALYTAPTKIPNPPMVTVTATSLADARRVSTQVTIVESNSSQQ